MEDRNEELELMLDRIFEIVTYNFSPKEMDVLKTTPKDKLYDFGLGLWLRNNIIFSDKKLYELFQQQGICHPDDMSAFIIEEIHNRLNGTT